MGLIANLVEFPAVPKGAARIRMQVMANHSEQNIADAVQILKTRQGRGRDRNSNDAAGGDLKIGPLKLQRR